MKEYSLDYCNEVRAGTVARERSELQPILDL